MKILKNSIDYSIDFPNLDEAKKYFLMSEKRKEELYIREDFLGTDAEFEDFKNQFEEYQERMRDAESLEELSDILNEYTDIFGNGTHYFVKEI